MPHDPRRFVEHVDFVTSPGMRDRREVPSRRGEGPRALITPRARFTFTDDGLTLDALAPGFTRAEALEGFTCDVPVASDLQELPEIEPELAVICDELLRLWGRGTG
jgi:glutaconate CoA-transferase subunit B